MKQKIKESLMIKTHGNNLNLDAGAFIDTNWNPPLLLLYLIFSIYVSFLSLFHANYTPVFHLVSIQFVAVLRFGLGAAEEGLRTEMPHVHFVFLKNLLRLCSYTFQLL